MMTQYVVFLRGINVGGKNIIQMNDLKKSLTEAGFSHVKTYIQSGNIVLTSGRRSNEAIENEIRRLILEAFGLEISVLALDMSDYLNAINNNPYKDPSFEDKTVHFAFLSEQVQKDVTLEIDKIRAESEEVTIRDKVLYFHAPDGIGRSKLAAKFEKILGVNVTMRNLRTVRKVKELLDEAAK